MAKKRLDGLDAVKLIAAAVIVLQHSILRGTGKSYIAFFIYGACHIAVPTFFAVAGYIAGLKPPTNNLKTFIRTRARRLLIPALFWMIFIPVFAYLRTGKTPWSPLTLDWVVASFVGGGSAWFLVVLFLVAVLATIADRKTSQLWPAYIGFAVFIFVGLAQLKSPVGLGFGTFYVFVPLYGAVYWAAMRFARHDWRPSAELAASVLALLALAAGGFSIARQVSGLQSFSWLMYAVSSLAALAALALAVDARIPWERILRPMGWARDATLGVYVVHIVLISYVFMFLPPMQPLLRAFVGAFVTFLLTAVLVSVARRWKVARSVL